MTDLSYNGSSYTIPKRPGFLLSFVNVLANKRMRDANTTFFD